MQVKSRDRHRPRPTGRLVQGAQGQIPAPTELGTLGLVSITLTDPGEIPPWERRCSVGDI